MSKEIEKILDNMPIVTRLFGVRTLLRTALVQLANDEPRFSIEQNIKEAISMVERVVEIEDAKNIRV